MSKNINDDKIVLENIDNNNDNIGKTPSKIMKILYRLPSKIIAVILFVIMSVTAVASIFGATFMVSEHYYSKNIEEVKNDIFERNAYIEAERGFESFLRDDFRYIDSITHGGNIDIEYFIEIDDVKSTYVTKNIDKTNATIYEFDVDSSISYEDENGEWTSKWYVATAKVYLDESLANYDSFYILNKIVNETWGMKVSIWIIFGISVVSTIGLFVLLMFMAGRKPSEKKKINTWFNKIPLEIILAAIAFAVFMLYAMSYESFIYSNSAQAFIVPVIGALGISAIFALLSMEIAKRVKNGTIFKYTLIHYLVLGLIIVGKFTGKLFKTAFVNMPLIWKSVSVYWGISLVYLLLLAISSGLEYFSYFILLWVLPNIVLFPLVVYLAIVLKRLLKGSDIISHGNLNYEVDTKHMVWEFKQAGDNLNAMSIGMAKAVEEGMKSERFKTELITNVSHDIKTPLTSIINYADLISKEPCDNTKITEYSEVLHRQSERLKKLIEDLVEASKATSGTVDVNLQPLKVGVMITQIMAEYESKYDNANLKLICNNPNENLKISADGKLLFRVFDNLFSNAFKYSLEGTRVYVSVEEIASEVVVTLKNTSRYELNMSAESLMERFVRGDLSRNSEGSGLGLSIAKSLTELQNGKIDLTVDGDLFKVAVKFKKIQ